MCVDDCEFGGELGSFPAWQLVFRLIGDLRQVRVGCVGGVGFWMVFLEFYQALAKAAYVSNSGSHIFKPTGTNSYTEYFQNEFLLLVP